MAWMSRLRGLFRRAKLTREFEEELAFHLSMREKLSVDEGMSPVEAMRDARRRFGNPAVWRERMSEIDLMLLPQTILQDLRYGARTLGRNARFTVVAILALALGIGINTIAFTFYKAMFTRSLDARDPGRMVDLSLVQPSGNTEYDFSYPDLKAYQENLHSFSGVIAHSVDRLTLSGAGGTIRNPAGGGLLGRLGLLPTSAINAEFATTFEVSENYFSVLGVNALRGRTFDAMSLRNLLPRHLCSSVRTIGRNASTEIRQSLARLFASMAFPSPSLGLHRTISQARASRRRISGFLSASFLSSIRRATGSAIGRTSG
jgi:hypothetical protein